MRSINLRYLPPPSYKSVMLTVTFEQLCSAVMCGCTIMAYAIKTFDYSGNFPKFRHTKVVAYNHDTRNYYHFFTKNTKIARKLRNLAYIYPTFKFYLAKPRGKDGKSYIPKRRGATGHAREYWQTYYRLTNSIQLQFNKNKHILQKPDFKTFITDQSETQSKSILVGLDRYPFFETLPKWLQENARRSKAGTGRPSLCSGDREDGYR